MSAITEVCLDYTITLKLYYLLCKILNIYVLLYHGIGIMFIKYFAIGSIK